MKPLSKSEEKCKYGVSEFALIPRRLSLRPPIRHKGKDSMRGLLPYEFAVMAGVLVAARLALGHQRRVLASDAAKRAMARQAEYYEQFERDWKTVKQARRNGDDEPTRAPELRTVFDAQPYYDAANEDRGSVERQYYSSRRPLKRPQMMRLTGREAYRRRLQKLRRQCPPETVGVSITPGALVRLAGLSKSGAAQYKLHAALERLLRAVEGDGEPSGPLLLRWHSVGRELQLDVSGEWLQPPYRKLLLPLPLRSASALALYLFADAVTRYDYRHWRNNSIRFDKLCDNVLGLPYWGAAVASRNFTSALKIVNEHLAWLGERKHYTIRFEDKGAKVRIVLWEPEQDSRQFVADDLPAEEEEFSDDEDALLAAESEDSDEGDENDDAATLEDELQAIAEQDATARNSRQGGTLQRRRRQPT